MIFDTFMFARELDMLECRLTELENIPNLVHVLVEAEVDHQDHPKPLYYADHRDRFAPWKDRIVHVVAGPLPTLADDPDAWAREHAQREYVAEGLRRAGCENTDIVLHGDVDEIPTVVAARNVRPRGMVGFEQRFHPFAVDWLHPQVWRGTVAAPAGKIRSFSTMRDARNVAPPVPAAGWHFSWVGSRAESLAKLRSFCHPEIAGRTLAGLEADAFLRDGWHVDGRRLTPVEVTAGRWPRWIVERRCPDSWWRPR